MKGLAISVEHKPKMSRDTLEVRKNYYVLEEDGKYHYFPIKIADIETERPIFRITKFPPVLVDGVVFIKRSAYKVTKDDILRGVVRKSRVIHQAKRAKSNGSSRNISSTGDTSGDSTSVPTDTHDTYSELLEQTRGTDLPANQDERALEERLEMEENAAADAALSHEIESLLDYLCEKENEAAAEWAEEDGSPTPEECELEMSNHP